MADPDGARTPNPRSLKAEEGPNYVPPSVPLVTQSSLKEEIRKEEDLYYGYVSEQTRKGHALGVDKTTGRVFEFIQDTDSGSAFDDLLGEESGGGGGTVRKVYDTPAALEGQIYYDNLKMAELDFERAEEDAKAAKAAMGSARSYLDVEADKTKEITRQFKDFENRASLLYDLMADEQDYGFSADKHNFDAWDAQRDLGLATMPGGFAGKPSMAMSLSSILRPSLPDYVRPDYRLNAAVGLPGPQGFDDPDYGPDGLPLYARGTDEFIRIPLKPLVYWPWSGRNGN